MKYTQTIYIGKEEAEAINRYLNVEPRNEAECLGEDQTVSHTAKFPNGFEVDVKLCGIQFRDKKDDESVSNCAWTEAVLFDDEDGQLDCTEPSDSYFGEWVLEHDGDEYAVLVKELPF